MGVDGGGVEQLEAANGQWFLLPSSMRQINEASSEALQSSRFPAPSPVTPRSFYRFGVDSCGITDLA